MSKYPISLKKDDLQQEKIARLINSLPHNINSKKFKQAANISRKGKEICDEMRARDIESNDEPEANSHLVLKAYFELWESLSLFWESLKQCEFNEAWNHLQDAISASKFCLKFMDNPQDLSVPELDDYLSSYEKLFPYKIFASIGGVIKKMHCSICGLNPLDSDCTHIPGELYMGNVATSIVEEFDINEVSMVEHPRDKHCIIFIEYDKKHPELSSFNPLYEISTRIEKPLRLLDIQMETIEENPNDIDCPEDFDCPCGSGLAFKDCCIDKSTIMVKKIRHVQITKHMIKVVVSCY